MHPLQKNLLFFVLLFFFLAASVFPQTTDQEKARPRKVIAKIPKARLITSGYKPARRTIELSKANLAVSEEVGLIEKEVFGLINLKRLEIGLAELSWDERLSQLARDHSEKMAVNGFFSHYGLNGRTVDARALDMGINDWSGIGENIAYNKGIKNPSGFTVESWMTSPGHKRNLLNEKWMASGIGVAVTDDGKYFFTQVFIAKWQ